MQRVRMSAERFCDSVDQANKSFFTPEIIPLGFSKINNKSNDQRFESTKHIQGINTIV